MTKNDNFFNSWALITGIIQLMDYQLNVTQVDNDTLLQHLNQQDKILEMQNTQYLEKIIQQNEIIIKKLTELND